MRFYQRLGLAIFTALALFSSALADDIRVYFNHEVNLPAKTANLEEKIIEVINNADTSLLMAVYDLELPGIAHAMVNAKNRGVDVRFITDEDNIGSDNAEALAILSNGLVPWIDDRENGSAGSNIQHNKFIIADGRTVLTGSTNFSQSGIHGDLNSEGELSSSGNDNHIVIIESTQLATAFTIQFGHMWGDGQGGAQDSLFGLGKPDHSLERVYTTNDNIAIDVHFTPQSPTQFAGSSIETLMNVVSTAQNRILVAQFVISAQDVADAMKARHEAGVEVRGIGDSSFFYRYFSEFQDMRGEAELNNNGEYETDSYTGAPNNVWATPADVRVAAMSGGDKWHHKYVVVDNTVVTGSHNVSGAAAFGNDENVVIIHDAETASEFEGHFNRAFCYAGGSTGCGGPQYEGGAWEGVAFTAEEVASVMDIANNASLYQLDIEAAMNKRAAENIIAARAIMDMDQLAAVPYVGPAAMQDLLNYISSW